MSLINKNVRKLVNLLNGAAAFKATFRPFASSLVLYVQSFSTKIKNKIYYFLLILNNDKLRLFIFIVSFIFISFILNENVVYCMDDNISSPESSGFSKSNNSSGENDLSSSSNITSNISLNITEPLNNLGKAAMITAATVGVATMMKVAPPNARAVIGLGSAALATSAYTITNLAETLYSSRNNSSSSINLSSDVNSEKISISNDSNISASLGIGNNKINVKLNKEELNIPDNINEGLSNSTNNYPASSIFENTELVSVIGNNPYLQLQYLILFITCVVLYCLIGFTISFFLNKYGDNFINRFKNKYILLYLNFSKKSNFTLLICILILLYIGLILDIISILILIDNFPYYCIDNSDVTN
jgi:hypothetical protein